MKLLIVTQKVDQDDQLLGFFTQWIASFSAQCEEVNVFCLKVGTYDLPKNVTVHSLGKDEQKPKIIWWWRLIYYSWILRKQYDAVFVHMNPIHVMCTGLWWRMLGKKIGLWYTHPSVNLTLRIATFFSHVIFTGSDSSFKIETNKKNVMGQGVNPDLFTFKNELNLESPQLIVVGRISPIKNITIAIEVLAELRETTKARLLIVGGPGEGLSSDIEYQKSLKALAHNLKVEDSIEWVGPKDNYGVQVALAHSDIFLHTSLTHSADKTLPEAMASGLFVVSSNKAYKTDLPAVCFKEPNAHEYVASIKTFLSMDRNKQMQLRKQLRVCVEEKHSLTRLVKNILARY